MGQGTRLGNPEEQQRNLTAIRNWSLRQTGDATATSQFTEMDPDSRGIKASSSLTNDDDCMYATISIYLIFSSLFQILMSRYGQCCCNELPESTDARVFFLILAPTYPVHVP